MSDESNNVDSERPPRSDRAFTETGSPNAMADMARLVDSLRTELLALRKRVSDLGEVSTHYSGRIRHLEVALEATRQQMLAFLSQRDQALECLNSVQTSATWRLTRLVRALERRWPRFVTTLVGFARAAAWLLSGKLTEQLRLRREAKAMLKARSFDLPWYIRQYPDVVVSGFDPLRHWLVAGWKEGRDPNPTFDMRRYLDENPDLLEGGVDPVVDFLVSRQRADRESPNQGVIEPVRHRLLQDRLLAMLPSQNGPVSVPIDCFDELAVIIPIQRGSEETRRCVKSVVEAVRNIKYRIILINDGLHPDTSGSFLEGIRSDRGVVMLNNVEPMGFWYSVNMGIRHAGSSDVVVLEDTTEVPAGWADGLVVHAYASADIATVAPFSNTGGIVSYAGDGGWRSLPEGESTETMNAAFAAANQGRCIDIPIAVRFCMYIKRSCLDSVGLFDVEPFVGPSSAEADFSRRVRAKGWRHILAADVFVTCASDARLIPDVITPAANQAANSSGHCPAISPSLDPHLGSALTFEVRVASIAARYKLAKARVVLLVTRYSGEDCDRYIRDLIAGCRGMARFLVLRPSAADAFGNDLVLQTGSEPGMLDLHISSGGCDFVLDLLRSFGVARVHVNHLSGFPDRIRTIILGLRVPLDLTVHDYHLVCPRMNLLRSDGVYCGEPEADGCLTCLSSDPKFIGGPQDIYLWRLTNAWLFHEADRVICPSQDVASRVLHYFPRARAIVVPHEAIVPGRFAAERRTPGPGEPLRVAMLGPLTRRSGEELVDQAAALIAARLSPIELVLIGSRERRAATSQSIRETGPYAEDDLPSLIDTVDPHLILFLSQGPETYSYTLSAALASGRPLAVTALGALQERVNGRPWVWTLVPGIDPEALVERLMVIAKGLRENHPPPIFGDSDIGEFGRVSTADFYPRLYLEAVDAGTEGGGGVCRSRPLVVVVPEGGTAPSTCSYIRLLLPLAEVEISRDFDVTVGTMEDICYLEPDIVLTNRDALKTVEDADRFVYECKRAGSRLIFDIDDDLLNLPSAHPDRTVYDAVRPALLRVIRGADSVWTSTSELARRLLELNDDVTVLPNGIKSELWRGERFGGLHADGFVLRILYMGTTTHAADLELAREAIARLAENYTGRVRLTLIGINDESPSIGWCDRLEPPPEARAYPFFVRWLIRQRAFDVGIAPLVDNRFNQCKSPMKILDYSALGLATVASNVLPYSPFITHGHNGLLADATVESWYEALERCLLDPENCHRLANRAQTEFLEEFSYGALAKFRNEALHHVVASFGIESLARNGGMYR